jgi:Flp pilus assembly CpaF family ATPase
LPAPNTGHDGALSTVHANSPTDALARLETLTLFAGVALPLPAVRAQIISAVDAVVQVTRERDGTRRLRAIAEVAPGRRVTTRPLLERGPAGTMTAAAAPSRPPRRVHVDLDREWHECARRLSH